MFVENSGTNRSKKKIRYQKKSPVLLHLKSSPAIIHLHNLCHIISRKLFKFNL